METICPLCGSERSGLVASVSCADIWKWLALEWGAQFSQETIDRHTVSDAIELRSCDACDLQFWSPAVPGSPQFYAELTSTALDYYNQESWEFGYVRDLLSPQSRVLDVACGSGAFVLSLKGTVSEAVGIDTNPAAIERATAQGGTVINATVENFAQTQAAAFDVVTAFQVLEHLDTLDTFLEAAYRCLRPGGQFIVSVPNRDRRARSQFEALDHPPHHLTRWSEAQLCTLAQRLNGEVETIAKEPMTRRQIINVLRENGLNGALPRRLPGRETLLKALSKLLLTYPLSLVMESDFMRKRQHYHGHTMLAVIRKAR